MTFRSRSRATAPVAAAALVAVMALAASPARAQAHTHHEPSAASPAPPASAASAPSAADWIDGEIRRIDVPQQRLTLKHGEIRHLDMPGMTMAFRLRPGLLDTAQLTALKVGDRIAFQVESREGRLQLTALRPRTAD